MRKSKNARNMKIKNEKGILLVSKGVQKKTAAMKTLAKVVMGTQYQLQQQEVRAHRRRRLQVRAQQVRAHRRRRLQVRAHNRRRLEEELAVPVRQQKVEKDHHPGAKVDPPWIRKTAQHQIRISHRL